MNRYTVDEESDGIAIISPHPDSEIPMNSGRVSNKTDGGAALSTVVSRLRCLLSGPCRFPLSLFRFPSAPIHLLLPTLAASPVSLDTFSLGRYKSHRYSVFCIVDNGEPP